MNIKLIYENKIPVIRINEKRIDTSNSGLIKAELKSFKEELANYNNVILDISDVESSDSSGLSCIIVANNLFDNRNGLILVNNSKKFLTLLEITQLDSALNIFYSIEEALKYASR